MSEIRQGIRDGIIPRDFEELGRSYRLLKRKIEDKGKMLLSEIQGLNESLTALTREMKELEAERMDLLARQYERRRRVSSYQISKLELRELVFFKSGNKCAACGSKENLTVDHIHPVLHGGSDELENLQALCRSCNSRKGARV